MRAGERIAPALEQAWLARGVLARALWPLSRLLAGWLALRRPQAAATLPVPVVVVGNLIAGGAGKTPTVMAVVRLLRRHGFTPGVVSRGHGAREQAPPTAGQLKPPRQPRRSTPAGGGVLAVSPETPAWRCGDEPLLLRIRLAVPVVVGRDRVAAARELLRAHPAVDILVADDGLQHHRLPRRAAVIVFDERGTGNGWLLPAGPLREPMTAAPPPRSVVLYNAARASTPWPGHLARRGLAGAVPLAGWWAGEAASGAALSMLAKRPLLAMAGVARPERFFSMLRDAGLGTLAAGPLTTRPLPDHFDFAQLPWPTDTPDVLLTEKDAVKLSAACCGTTRVWVAPLDFEPPPAFDAELLALLATP